MKFRTSLIIAIFLLVVIPILLTGLISIETADKALQLQAAQTGIPPGQGNAEFHRLQENVIYVLIIGIVVSLTGAGIFASELAGSVQVIREGLDSLSRNSATKIKPMRGVMGEIAASINEMAAKKRLLEEQVLRAGRLAALGELAAGIAHEIRNPLTSVKGYAQLLDEELPPGDEKREYVSVIEKEVNRLDRIVQELLAFARPAQSHFQPVDLNAVIDETLLLVENRTFRRQIDLHKEYGQDVLVEADKEQIKQIILNLLLNAIQAIPDKGIICIGTHLTDDFATIRIRDSGIGIPSEHIDKLFDPFFTTKEKGTGLGLAIVHQLLELHQGHIHVRKAVPAGTEFEIRLPLRQGGISP